LNLTIQRTLPAQSATCDPHVDQRRALADERYGSTFRRILSGLRCFSTTKRCNASRNIQALYGRILSPRSPTTGIGGGSPEPANSGAVAAWRRAVAADTSG